MSDIVWESINIRIKELTDYQNNPRRISKEQFKKLVESLQQDGYHQRIIADVHNRVIGGHQRKKALIAAGYSENDEIEILRANRELTEEEFKRINIRDNLQHGEWDLDILANNFDADLLVDWGFDEKLLGIRRDANEGLTDPDELPEPGAHPISQLGDIWLLGHHRIICGDATNINTLGGLIDGAAIDLVFTDPPYGIDVVKNNQVGGGGETKFGGIGGRNIVNSRTYKKIENDHDTQAAHDFYIASQAYGVENFIIFGGNYFTDFLPPSRCWIVWDKENTGNFSQFEMAWTSYDKAAKMYRWLWNGLSRKGDRQTEGVSRVHPTQKPVGLFIDIFDDFKPMRVLDGFLGSGSTLIACEKSERVCYGMELEPYYIDTAIRRWQEFTGLKAIHESRNKTFAEIEAERLKDVA